MQGTSCSCPCLCMYSASRNDDHTPQRIGGTCSSALIAHSVPDGIRHISGQMVQYL